MVTVSKGTLRFLYLQWEKGNASKSQLEREYLDDTKSHGKRITKLWRDVLGVETEKRDVCPHCGEQIRA